MPPRGYGGTSTSPRHRAWSQGRTKAQRWPRAPDSAPATFPRRVTSLGRTRRPQRHTTGTNLEKLAPSETSEDSQTERDLREHQDHEAMRMRMKRNMLEVHTPHPAHHDERKR